MPHAALSLAPVILHPPKTSSSGAGLGPFCGGALVLAGVGPARSTRQTFTRAVLREAPDAGDRDVLFCGGIFSRHVVPTVAHIGPVETSDRQAVRRDRLAPSHSITTRSSGSLYRPVPAPSVATNYGSWWPVSTSLPSGSSAAQVHIVGVGELPRVNGIGPHLIPLGGVGTISSSRMDLLEHLDRRFGPIGPNGF